MCLSLSNGVATTVERMGMAATVRKEPSAFHRAFKRWTGHAPRSYRNSAQARASRAD
jgi:hypothetical protein